MSGVRCIEMVELVTEWMEGALDDETHADVEQHLVVCPPCGAYVSQIRAATAALHDADAEGADVAVRDQLLQHFRAQRPT